MVYFEPTGEGFSVFVPAISDICTFGSTLDEAREMAKDAIHCVLESSIKHGEPIPTDIGGTMERLTVSI